MARIDPKSLTVDYKSLMKASVSNRMAALKGGMLNDTLFSLTPTQYALLFPKYYLEKAQLPAGFGELKSALSGMTPVSGGVSSMKAQPFKQTEVKPSWLTALEKQTGMSMPSAQQLQQSEVPAGAKGTYRNVYNLSEADLSDDVVNTIAGEARLSDPRGVDAVVNNMLNRVGTKGWGPSENMQQVARAPGQYTGYRKATPEEAAMIRERIKAVASGSVPDPTNGADSYRASSYLEGAGRGKTFDNLAREQGYNNVGGNVFAKDPKVQAGPYAPYSAEQVAKNIEEQKQKDPAKSDIAVEDGPAAKASVEAKYDPPKGMDPNVINYYNGLSTNQKQQFLAMIDKAGGVEAVNKLYTSNPPQVANKNMDANIQSYTKDGMKYVNFQGAEMGKQAAADLGISTKANYGKEFFGGRIPSKQEAEQATVPVTSASGKTFHVNSAAAGNYQGFIRELESMGYYIDPKDTGGGGFNYRQKKGAPGMSEHAFANAIDIDPSTNPDQARSNRLPPNVGQIAAKYGLTWGGYWDRRDSMHFEYNPAHGVSATSNVQDFDERFLADMKSNPQTYVNADVLTPQILAQNPNLSNEQRMAAVQNTEQSKTEKMDEQLKATKDATATEATQLKATKDATATEATAKIQQQATTGTTDIMPPETVVDKQFKEDQQQKVAAAESSSWTSWVPFLKDGGEVQGENLAIVDKDSGETVAHSNDREGYQFSKGKIKVTPAELQGRQEVQSRIEEGSASKTPDADLSRIPSSSVEEKKAPRQPMANLSDTDRFFAAPEAITPPPSLVRAYAKAVVAPFGAGAQNEKR